MKNIFEKVSTHDEGHRDAPVASIGGGSSNKALDSGARGGIRPDEVNIPDCDL